MPVSNMANAAAGSPSRGCPTEPSTASHCLPPQQLHRDAGGRNEARHLRGGRHRIERRLVDVAAEGDVGVGRHDAARGIRRCSGHSAIAQGCWLRNERRGDRPPAASAAVPPENAAAPALSLPRVHSIAAWASAFMVSDGGADGVVVVAAHGHGAAVDQAHHRLDRPFRIGAIADDNRRGRSSVRRRARARNRGRRRKACRLAWISAKIASSTLSSARNPIDRAGAGFDGYQTTARGPAIGSMTDLARRWHIRCDDERAEQSDQRLTRRFQAPEQQRQHGVDPRRRAAGSFHSSAWAG